MRSAATDEYQALRATIGARSHVRVGLALGGFLGWAAVLVATLVALPFPVAAAIPLVVLLAAFEAIRPLHFGAERIGRYLQVFHEEADAGPGGPLEPPAWERTAMLFGPSVPGAAGHPLFVPVFTVAAAVNFLAVVLPGPVPIELGAMAVLHLAFVAWLLRADRAMRAQRQADLVRYRALRDSTNARS